jgi:hypothetical protein
MRDPHSRGMVFGVNQFCPLAAIRLTVEKGEVDVA